MTEQEFEQILLQSESTILDFKRQQYDFSTDPEDRKTAEFVKDIISFANTVRSESALIVLGVKVHEDGKKELLGLTGHLDDAILQQKIRNKVDPIPYFSYKAFSYKGKSFGVIEIPIKKYVHPISPVLKLKGLEPGKFYFRSGSSNDEATGLESIRIAKWLEGLPEETNQSQLVNSIHLIISKITNGKIKLSECISETLKLATKFNLKDLKYFCENEISGLNGDFKDEGIQESYGYRLNRVLITSGKIDFPQYLNWDSRRMIKEIEKIDGVFERQFLFKQSILEIEDTILKLSGSNSIIVTFKLPSSSVTGNKKFKDVSFLAYANIDNFENLHKNIRQKLIDKLFLGSQ